MPFVETKGESLYYASGPSPGDATLICIHGSGGDHTHWPAKLCTLPKMTVAAIDLPGHGRSGGRGRRRIEAYAEVVADFVEALDLKRVVLMGHSLGGAVAQVLALSEPDWLERIILVGTGARLRVLPSILSQLENAPRQTVDRMCEMAFGPGAPPSLVAAVRQRWLQLPTKIIRDDFAACDVFDIMQTVGRIRLPTLVVSGSEDRLTPPKYGDYLAAHIRGAKQIVMAGAGHMMALEFPDDFVQHLESFLHAEPAFSPRKH